MENISEQRYKKAKERVNNIKSFYNHFAVYCIIIPALAYLNFRTTSFAWVLFPAIGWGFGLLGHWMDAFGKNPFFGKEWEQRKIHEFMNDTEF
ncbi:2TM domain-containing protein [Flagellimonas allohymeniacidonis]|uniref:2TM domain-containing protein n=1 Tax=Flagellimonas allohymeniacidonis TaxID=2517819 RepID=A0A4Q8QH14_9FLAO|nr:2TM domain-containing protein [Allomuricauda hymeniacidonis]TAI49224.1 2TM domain-containing protein [Allomuricauda hymeniacidonis]